MIQSDVTKYRLRALECGQKAGTARHPKDKANWQELERVWLDLALRIEAEEKSQPPAKIPLKTLD
jgi:hypothetical protein